MKNTVARTYLFVPGDRPERFAKACAAGAHAVIIDLEDAVPPAAKQAARAAAAGWVSPDHPVFVRVNGAGSEWFTDDLALCGLPGVAGIVLPKAESPADVARIKAAGATLVLPLIETAQGVWNAHALATTSGVQRLMFGSIDFQLDAGFDGDVDELLYVRSQLVLVSRVAGIQSPVDGVTTAIDDPEQLRADTQRARRLGFGGKLCIHPKQVEPVNRYFMPGDEDIAWARRVLQAAEAAQGAAVALDGKMVDLPVIRKAEEIMSEAERAEKAGN
ncbi:MAG TPA: CoA ester lyase [Noviherbaspirillum sp.]|uniref:HpcH/HpaI aldolase/citrate lyase family protein n=1 Tax=Noviherbaspirillum sp. TaxID=1926288 RepID=UPI002B48C0DF|nr:CoA ester lyase [Noviherbaspirillum sp.]HJV84396.1 CoA ester lyase [Noviherbaspirillum sp.]